jgi:magnesium transporter
MPSGWTGMREVTAAIFRDGNVIEHVSFDACRPLQGESEFTWIEVLDPLDSDFELLQERFGLPGLAVEDSMRPEQIPKVDLYDEQIFVVLKVAHLEGDAIVYGEIDAFVSTHHIITICRTAASGHAHARDRFQSGPRLTQARPDFILHGILDYVVNGYFPIVQMVEDEVLTMEQHLHDALLDRGEITRLFRLRRETIHFKHTLARMSDVCGKLANLDVPSIGAESRPYFRVMHEHLTRLDAMVSGLIEVIRSVFETSSLLELQRQGIITRQLAAWAAILGVPAAIAGIYATTAPNVPELKGFIGYAIVIGVMASICLGLYFRFRKLNWL